MLLMKAQKYLDVVRKRGEAGTTLTRVYRMLCCQELYLLAYAKLYANSGALTPGVDLEDTVDGMSLQRIDVIVEQVKQRTYRWKPVRRTSILKRDKTHTRPLGLPGWNDKLVQEVIRLILKAYYEPQFRDCSHGFRPHRGCHTALETVQTWNGVRWFIEGDIKGCFDGIHHEMIIGILRRKIHDETFLKFIQGMLQAGYMDNWKYFKTYSGTPQGGIVSPLLANIVLNELDTWVEDALIPTYTRGKQRKVNPEYKKLTSAAYRARKKGDWRRATALRKMYTRLPYGLSNDPEFRRLRYVRYADDVLFGYIGTKAEAKVIKQQFGAQLQHLKLEMSEEKTLITHARTRKARFLNYEINVMQSDSKTTRNQSDRAPFKKRSINGQIWFSVPEDVIEAWKAKVSQANDITHRAELLNRSDYDIVSTYEIELQGLINYYSKVHNTERLRYLRYIWEESLIKTLAAKHKTKVTTICKRYKTFSTGSSRRLIGVEIPRDQKKPLRAIFGKKPIQREKDVIIQDTISAVYATRNELIARVLAGKCELCGKEGIPVEGHHLKKLKDLQKRWKGRKEKPAWVEKMIAIRRKTLFVCRDCHKTIHRGEYDGAKLT